MPIYSRFVVKKKEKKEKKRKKKIHTCTLANKLEARLHWARSPVSGFSREKRGIEKKITKETSTKEGRNLHALQAVSTETTRSVSSLSVPRSHPPSPSFCASRRNESGCTFYVWPPRYAPEFCGSRVRRDKFYLTLPLLTSVPELKGDERWMARKLGRRKNDKEEKNGGEREDRPPCSLHRFRF